MDNQNLHIPILELERRFRSIMVRMPALLGNEAVNFVLDNFKLQGFMGATFQPWLKRKNPTKWGQAPKRNGRAVLIDTGQLRRSIRIVRTTADSVLIGTDDPKAKAHNEGLKIGLIQKVGSYERKGVAKKKVTVKEHTRRINQNIPKRQFIGDSPYLRTRLSRIIQVEIMKALR